MTQESETWETLDHLWETQGDAFTTWLRNNISDDDYALETLDAMPIETHYQKLSDEVDEAVRQAQEDMRATLLSYSGDSQTWYEHCTEGHREPSKWCTEGRCSVDFADLIEDVLEI